MSGLPRSTIEQWSVLRAVVNHGGFAAAAETLHRSQSSVSYALARLRDAVGVDLLEQRGRRAVLTEAGAALLTEVGPLIEELDRIERRGRGIGRGGAVRIRLFVDTLFPKDRLFAALRQIAETYPDAEIRMVETVRQTIDDLQPDAYDLAILVIQPEATDSDRIADIRLVAVASNSHPLLAASGPLTKAALARYPFAEMRDYTADSEMPSRTGRRWRMSTVESAIDAVRYGLCYAWLPEHLIENDLRDGSLRRLPLERGSVRHVPLGIYCNATLSRNDPAAFELMRLLSRRQVIQPAIAK